MQIYKKTGENLTALGNQKFNLEKHLQILIERNLDKVFGLKFVASEFQLNNLRIDTVAFDTEINTFVLIEYKRDRSFSVIDQGFAYLALALNNKADFVLLYNAKFNKNFQKDDIDWSQIRVIFVAETFTTYQQEAIGFQDLPIELWEVSPYEGDLLVFNQLKASKKSESIKKIAKSEDMSVVSREVKPYTVEDHIKSEWSKTKELFDELSTRLLELDPSLEIKPVKSYIGFRLGTKNLVNVRAKSAKLTIELLRTQPQDVKDPEGKVSYFNNSFKYYNQHVSLIDVEDTDGIEYATMIIKQIYKRLLEN